MGLFKEFKTFTLRGNVIDLSIGVIIGSAFGKIVSSFVSDVIMPPIGLLIGGVNFTDIKFKLKSEVFNSSGHKVQNAVTINIGNFIQTIFDFIVIAGAVFFIIKTVNRFYDKGLTDSFSQLGLSKTEKLLTEIRDLLKNK